MKALPYVKSNIQMYTMIDRVLLWFDWAIGPSPPSIFQTCTYSVWGNQVLDNTDSWSVKQHVGIYMSHNQELL